IATLAGAAQEPDRARLTGAAIRPRRIDEWIGHDWPTQLVLPPARRPLLIGLPKIRPVAWQNHGARGLLRALDIGADATARHQQPYPEDAGIPTCTARKRQSVHSCLLLAGHAQRQP